MGIQRIRSRVMFAPAEVVELTQSCFTLERVFQPGKYQVEDLPDIAFEMGLVQRLAQKPSLEETEQETGERATDAHNK